MIDGIDFNDANELITEGGPFAYDGTIKTRFTVPTTISLGYTVMRVSMKYGSYPTPCEIFAYGEVEDYPIELSNTKFGNDLNIANISARDIFNPLPRQFELYPNPTNNFIKITQIGSERVTYKIYNLMGELVKSSVMDNGGVIDVSGLSKGVYNIQFNTKRRLENKQFVKY